MAPFDPAGSKSSLHRVCPDSPFSVNVLDVGREVVANFLPVTSFYLDVILRNIVGVMIQAKKMR